MILTVANWVCALILVAWLIVCSRRLAEVRRTVEVVRAHCLNRYWAANGRQAGDEAVESFAGEILAIIATHE